MRNSFLILLLSIVAIVPLHAQVIFGQQNRNASTDPVINYASPKELIYVHQILHKTQIQTDEGK